LPVKEFIASKFSFLSSMDITPKLGTCSAWATIVPSLQFSGLFGFTSHLLLIFPPAPIVIEINLSFKFL